LWTLASIKFKPRGNRILRFGRGNAGDAAALLPSPFALSTERCRLSSLEPVRCAQRVMSGVGGSRFKRSGDGRGDVRVTAA